MLSLDMNSNGNALFLILIAVALFAALSYAVIQSGRGGGNIDREQREIRVSELIQVFGNVRAAVNRLKLINGCSNEQISVYSDSYATPAIFDNTNTPVAGGDFTCHVHHPDGGNVLYFGESDRDYLCTSDGAGCGTTVMSVSGDHSVVGIGTPNVDLMYLIDRVDEDFRVAFNNFVGIDVTSVPNDNTSIDSTDTWDGTYDDASPRVIGDGDPIFVGQDMGCFDSGSSNGNAIYAILIAR